MDVNELKSMMGLAPLDVLRMNVNTAQRHVTEFVDHEKSCPDCSKEREGRSADENKGYQRAATDLNHLLVTKVAGLISMTMAQGQLIARMTEKAPPEAQEKVARETALGSLAVYSALIPLLIEVAGITAVLAGKDKDKAIKSLDLDELLTMIGSQFGKAENKPTAASIGEKPEAEKSDAEKAANRELAKLKAAVPPSASLN